LCYQILAYLQNPTDEGCSERSVFTNAINVDSYISGSQLHSLQTHS